MKETEYSGNEQRSCDTFVPQHMFPRSLHAHEGEQSSEYIVARVTHSFPSTCSPEACMHTRGDKAVNKLFIVITVVVIVVVLFKPAHARAAVRELPGRAIGGSFIWELLFFCGPGQALGPSRRGAHGCWRQVLKS